MSDRQQTDARRPEEKPSVQFPTLEGAAKESVQFPSLDDLSRPAREQDGGGDDWQPQSEAAPESGFPNPSMLEATQDEDEPQVDVPDLDEATEAEYDASRGKLFNWAKTKDDKQWKTIQRIGGLIAGLAVSAAVLLSGSGSSASSEGSGSFLNWGFIAALAIAMLVPNYLEKKLGRSVAHGRIVMIIVFAIALVGMLLRNLAAGNFSSAA